MKPLILNPDFSFVTGHPLLTETQKKFLVNLLHQGYDVNLVESHSEILDVPNANWVRMCNDEGYYAAKLEELLHSSNRAVAFIVTPLVQDLNIWSPDEDDKAQIQEIKKGRLMRLFPEDYIDETLQITVE